MKEKNIKRKATFLLLVLCFCIMNIATVSANTAQIVLDEDCNKTCVDKNFTISGYVQNFHKAGVDKVSINDEEVLLKGDGTFVKTVSVSGGFHSTKYIVYIKDTNGDVIDRKTVTVTRNYLLPVSIVIILGMLGATLIFSFASMASIPDTVLPKIAVAIGVVFVVAAFMLLLFCAFGMI